MPGSGPPLAGHAARRAAPAAKPLAIQVSDQRQHAPRHRGEQAMKFAKRTLLVTGLLTGTLTFVGCGAHTPAVRESPYEDNTNSGFGHISKTKQSDDNLWMPLEDPLRTKEHESIVAAE